MRAVIWGLMMLALLRVKAIPEGLVKLLDSPDPPIRMGARIGARALVASTFVGAAQGFARSPSWLALLVFCYCTYWSFKGLLTAEAGNTVLLQQFLTVAAWAAIITNVTGVIRAVGYFTNPPGAAPP